MADFFAMGGYGFYVWGSYGAAALLIIIEVILLVRRKKMAIQRIKSIRKIGSKVKNET